MTDSKKQPGQKASEPNSLKPDGQRKIERRSGRKSAASRRMSIANIVQGLPFHRQLSTSQSLLLRVTPVWHDWCEQKRSIKGSKQFSAANDTSLSSFNEGVLTFACHNTVTATALKNNQTSLLEAFHAAGFEQIERLRIKMALTQTVSSKTTLGNQHNNDVYRNTSSTNRLEPLQISRKKPSDSSIKSVESVQIRTKNEHLADALQRLANTLKKQ